MGCRGDHKYYDHTLVDLNALTKGHISSPNTIEFIKCKNLINHKKILSLRENINENQLLYYLISYSNISLLEIDIGT